MRYSVLLTATFAMSAVAFPINFRSLMNKRQIDECITVYEVVGSTISSVQNSGDCSDVTTFQVGDDASVLEDGSSPDAATPTHTWHHHKHPAATAPAAAAASTPAAAASTPAADTGSTTGTSTDGFLDVASFQASVLAAHNAARVTFGNVPALTWSDSLATFAQTTTDSCTFEHTSGTLLASENAGENIAENSGDVSPADEVTTQWVSESTGYDFSNPGFTETTGHFTQVVWKSTTQVGCAVRTDCKDQYGNSFKYIKCDYSPPGNYGGEFPQNVFPAS